MDPLSIMLISLALLGIGLFGLARQRAIAHETRQRTARLLNREEARRTRMLQSVPVREDDGATRDDAAGDAAREDDRTLRAGLDHAATVALRERLYTGYREAWTRGVASFQFEREAPERDGVEAWLQLTGIPGDVPLRAQHHDVVLDGAPAHLLITHIPLDEPDAAQVDALRWVASDMPLRGFLVAWPDETTLRCGGFVLHHADASCPLLRPSRHAGAQKALRRYLEQHAQRGLTLACAHLTDAQLTLGWSLARPERLDASAVRALAQSAPAMRDSALETWAGLEPTTQALLWIEEALREARDAAAPSTSARARFHDVCQRLLTARTPRGLPASASAPAALTAHLRRHVAQTGHAEDGAQALVDECLRVWLRTPEASLELLPDVLLQRALVVMYSGEALNALDALGEETRAELLRLIRMDWITTPTLSASVRVVLVRAMAELFTARGDMGVEYAGFSLARAVLELHEEWRPRPDPEPEYGVLIDLNELRRQHELDQRPEPRVPRGEVANPVDVAQWAEMLRWVFDMPRGEGLLDRAMEAVSGDVMGALQAALDGEEVEDLQARDVVMNLLCWRALRRRVPAARVTHTLALARVWGGARTARLLAGVLPQQRGANARNIQQTLQHLRTRRGLDGLLTLDTTGDTLHGALSLDDVSDGV